MSRYSNIKPGVERDSNEKSTSEPRWDRDFPIGRTRRDLLERLFIVCGRVGSENARSYETKAKTMNADFILEERNSWVFTLRTIQHNYNPDYHRGVLLIGSNKQLPGTQINYQNSYGYSDWFVQDADGDGIPDAPVGRVFGEPATVLYHMDPNVIDSNIAVVFDSQPGRSNRHVDALKELGFDVEVLSRYTPTHAGLLGASEFILQFSDGVFASRIHGTPDQWASRNSVILSSRQAEGIVFRGYPVVFSEACSTALEGPLLQAFLRQGAAYIGSTLDTLNNIQPFDDWRQCAYSDGWKFGFMDLLDSYDLIGEVKVSVDKEITRNLAAGPVREIDQIRSGQTSVIQSDEALSTVEWTFFGNPMRRSTVGPNADYSPGKLIVDT
jgi:hypothetical protein